MARTLTTVHSGIPVDPNSPAAQDWVRNELAKPEYRAAKPTWFDIASKAVQDWLTSLFDAHAGNAGPVLVLVVVLLVAAIVVAAFLYYGRPRVNRRSTERPRALFGAEEPRTADDLRRSAAAAAAAADWVLAIEDGFRAIAVSLDERTLVPVSPGTTATDFATRAGRLVPEEREPLLAAARAFDEVRYLGRTGGEGPYRLIVALDARLQQLRPAIVAVQP